MPGELRDQITEAVLVYYGWAGAGRSDSAVKQARGVADAVMPVVEPRILQGSRAVLYIIDAVKQHGDKAAINAAHAALAYESAPNAVDERNELRRQVVDLRDELETMTRERDAKHTEASELAAQRTSAELRAEDAEAAIRKAREPVARLRSWYHDPEATVAQAGTILRDLETALSPAGGRKGQKL